jgi:hypothetical protein
MECNVAIVCTASIIFKPHTASKCCPWKRYLNLWDRNCNKGFLKLKWNDPSACCILQFNNNMVSYILEEIWENCVPFLQQLEFGSETRFRKEASQICEQWIALKILSCKGPNPCVKKWRCDARSRHIQGVQQHLQQSQVQFQCQHQYKLLAMCPKTVA